MTTGLLDEEYTIEPPVLDSYTPLTPEQVRMAVTSAPSKSCESGLIPTELLKVILPSILDLLTEITNVSLSTGTFLDNLKDALVKPLLKKASFELFNKNCRPVSNLPFLGKHLEQCVTNQLMEHIQENGLLEPLLLAYQLGHSTEMAVLKVKTDILKAIDKLGGSMSCPAGPVSSFWHSLPWNTPQQIIQEVLSMSFSSKLGSGHIWKITPNV